MNTCSFAYYLAVRDLRFPTVERLPSSPGAYALYDGVGQLLYVGMAKDLRATVLSHLVPSEDNPMLRDQVATFRVFPTRGVREAEAIEGRLFDTYLRHYGLYPPANRHRPPGSQISDDEVVQAGLRRLGRLPELTSQGSPPSRFFPRNDCRRLNSKRKSDPSP